MKGFKKIIAVVLATCILSTSNVVSYAQPNDNINDIAKGLIQSAIADPNATFDIGSYSISEQIPSYFLSNGVLSDFNEAEYYVVFCDQEAVGIFTVSGANSNSPTYSIGEEFVYVLDEAVLSSYQSYSFVVTENQIFAVTDTAAHEVMKYDTMLSSYGSEKSVQTYIPDEYTSSDVLSYTLTYDSIIQKTTTPHDELVIPNTRAIVQVAGTVPNQTQAANSNWCWAFASWCVGETLTDVNTTPQACAEHVGKKPGQGGNNTDQMKILKDIYSLSPASHDTLDNSTMKKLIDNGDPFILNCYTTSVTALGHSVTCYAYNDGYSPIRLGVMDSLVAQGASNWRWMTTSGTSYKITNGTNTYTYKYTTTPNGI